MVSAYLPPSFLKTIIPFDNVFKWKLVLAEAKLNNSSISVKLVEGRPAPTIIETAKAGAFDMIVMGSRGLGGIKEFFLGSVSHRVAEEAPCLVLIVK